MGKYRENFVEKMEKMPKLDLLAVFALGLNIFVIYSESRINSLQELLEPAASHEIMIIQLSALMAVLFLAEYLGDEEDSHSSIHSSGGEEKGLMPFIAGLAEGNTVVDGVVIAVVFLGYQQISQNASPGTSLTEFSLNPEAIAMQASVLIMANFALYLVVDFMKKDSKH